MTTKKLKHSDEEIQAFQRREEQRQEREFLMESIQNCLKQELTMEELRTLYKLIPKFREISRYFELTKILSRTF